MTPFRKSAQLLGALNAFVGLTLSVLSAIALNNLATQHLCNGILLLIIVLAIRTGVSFASEEWGFATARTVRDHWRSGLARHLAIPRFSGDRSRAELAQAIDHASEGPLLDLLLTSAQLSLLGVGVVFWAVGWLSSAIIVALLLLAVPFYIRAGKQSAEISSDYNHRRAVLESRQLELLDHAVELRGLGGVAYGSNEIGAISDSEHKIALRAIRVALGSSLVTEFISGVSIGLVAMVVGFGLLNGTIHLQHALIAVLVTSEIFSQVRRYGSEFHRRENAMRSIALLTLSNRVPGSSSTNELLRASKLVTHVNSTPFDSVILPGSQLLITGASGSGKTSLLHTLLGWLTPTQGEVELSADRIGFVSPNSGLLSGSLWENLTLGENHDRLKVAQLLSDLGLDENRFGDLEGLLLADGRGISSGEQVRLVLARTLLAEPQLVLLDDIAGLLDAASKQNVQNVLARYSNIAIIEATVDNPILTSPSDRFEVRS